jgi:hypothetical protein
MLRIAMHRKSQKKLSERRIRGIILRGSFNDRKGAEIVCQVTRLDVLRQLTGPVEVCKVPDVEKGEVLADSRGRGSFQKENGESYKVRIRFFFRSMVFGIVEQWGTPCFGGCNDSLSTKAGFCSCSAIEHH